MIGVAATGAATAMGRDGQKEFEDLHEATVGSGGRRNAALNDTYVRLAVIET